MSYEVVKKQFGTYAEAYGSSAVHATGDSLARLVALVEPEASWRLLDVATGGGHTAFALGAGVEELVLLDITVEMLAVAAKVGREKGIENGRFVVGEAEALPFENDYFDCVSCRIAPHHFVEIQRFIAEAERVLKPGGILAVVDNIVPGSRPAGKRKKKKKERLLDQAGEYVNAFEKLRDPSHGRCWSVYEWRSGLREAGLRLVKEEFVQKEMNFSSWADRMGVAPLDKVRLEVMLRQAPEEVVAFLTPKLSGDRMKFHLTEGIFIAKKADGQ